METVKVSLLVTAFLCAVQGYEKHNIIETKGFTHFLTGGSFKSEGRLMLTHNASQLYVCASPITATTGSGLCEMLGYPNVGYAGFDVIYDGRYGPVKGQPVVSYIECKGNETLLDQCNIKTSYYCPQSNFALGLSCLTSNVFFWGGLGKWNGRLQYDFNGSSLYVCPKGLDDTDATVACKMVFKNSGVSVKGINMGTQFSVHSDIPTHALFNCKGNEDDLALCPISIYPTGSKAFKKYCDNSQPAGIQCRAYAPVRLVGGNSSSEGRVEVQVNGTWGSVCQISNKEAQVICRTLGYWHTDPVVRDPYYFGPGSRQHAVAQLYCDGSEPDVGICRWYNDTNYCSPTHHLGVSCYPADVPAYSIRLVGDYRPWRGRVEIYSYKVWGTLHTPNTHNNTAEPICRTMGYRWVGRPYYYNSIPLRPGFHVLESLTCNGTEQNIGQCMSTGDKFPSVDTQTLNVDCMGYSQYVRLVNGRHPLEGRVEIFYNGQWGTICDAGWGLENTDVLCQSLGIKSDQLQYFYNAHFGEGTGPIHFTNMNCGYYRNHIAQCPSQNGSSCVHSEDIGVSCMSCVQSFNKETGSVTSGKYASECVYIIKPGNGSYKLNVTSIENYHHSHHTVQIRDRINGKFLGEYRHGGSAIIAGNEFWVHYFTLAPAHNSYILEWSPLHVEDVIAVNCSGERWDVSVNVTNLNWLYTTDPQYIYLGKCNTHSTLADGALYITSSLSDCHTQKKTSGNVVTYENTLAYHDRSGVEKWKVPIKCTLPSDSL